MNSDEITHQYEIITDSNNYTQDEINNANEFDMSFRTQPECIEWILSTYENIENILIRVCQLIILKQWCNGNWDAIYDSQEIRDALKSLLFTQAYHDASHGNASFDNVLADTQLSFMWKTFPDIWGTFWTDFFSNFNDEYQLEFLVAFTKFSSQLESRDNKIYKDIKDAMRANESDKLITQLTVKMMKDGSEKAFEVFASLCTWVNVLFLVNDDTVSIIRSALEYDNYVKYSLDILSCLMSRGIQDDIKFALISQLEITNQIQMTMSKEPGSDIAKAAAYLVNSAGQVVINSPDFIEAFFDLALAFLSYNDDDVSSYVFPLLTQICKENEEASSTILMKILERFQACIEDPTDETGFIDKLTDLSNNAMKGKFKDNFESSMSLFNDGQALNSDPKLAVSIICIVSNSLSGGKPPDFVEIAVNTFKIILEIDSQIDPIFSLGIIRFIKFFIAVGDQFSEKVISPIFQRLCYFSLLGSDSVDEDFHNNITQALSQFLKRLNKKIGQNFDTDIIAQFISSQDDQLVASAGFLIGSITSDQNRDHILRECLSNLQGISEQIEEERRSSFALTVLSFIKSVRYVEGAPYLQTISDCLNSYFDQCSQNDYLFEVFIRTVYSSLGNDCLDLISKCFNSIDIGNLSINAFCEVMQAVLKSEIPKGDWVGQITDYLFTIISQKFSLIQAYETEASKSEENREILNMTCNYFKLFACAMGICPEFIDPNLYNRMKGFLYEALTQHFDNPVLVENCIDFISAVSSNDFDSICDDGFVKFIVFFFYADKFDPNQKAWYNVIKRLLSFHFHLLNTNADKARPIIAESLADFLPDTVEDKNNFINSYFEIFDNERPRDQKAQGRLFFIRYKKLLSSN